MSNLAVLLYQNVILKPVGIPDLWACEVIDLGEGSDLPDERWTLMTSEDYVTFVSTNQAAYDAWALTNVGGRGLLENYKVDEYLNGNILSTSWYETKIADAYSNLARQITYTYLTNNSLKQIDNITYNSIGQIIRHEVTKFYTDTATNKVITETEVI